MQTPTTCTILIFIRNDYRGCCNATGRVPPAADGINTETRETQRHNFALHKRRVFKTNTPSASANECVGDIRTHIRTNTSCIAATDVTNVR